MPRATVVVSTVIAILAVLITVEAKRHGVIIHAVGDSATAGDPTAFNPETAKGSDRYSGRFSYRRYLYHMLESRGYSVRFVGSKSDCEVPGLDFDSHHDGYAKSRVNDIRNAVNGASDAIRSSFNDAVESLNKEGVSGISVVRVVSAGIEDAVAGRSSKELSDNDIRSLVDTVDSLTSGAGDSISRRNTLVVPSPPPGGNRVSDNGVFSLERDFQRDSRYEDYRFFLTWRGTFFDHRKNAADCLSYFDFLQHYNEEGTALNAFGDMAFARCIFDNLVVRQYITPITDFESVRSCTGDTTGHLTRRVPSTSNTHGATKGTTEQFEPALVNKKLPPLTTLVAPAVLFDAAQQQHPSCSKPPTAAEKASGACAKTPAFPEYEPFQTTKKDLWARRGAK
jgi:hypothetical protein